MSNLSTSIERLYQEGRRGRQRGGTGGGREGEKRKNGRQVGREGRRKKKQKQGKEGAGEVDYKLREEDMIIYLYVT